MSFMKDLFRKRVEEQSDNLGKRRINPAKRVRKGKPYADKDLQSLYEYTRIKMEKEGVTKKK